MKLEYNDIILRPIITEKTTNQRKNMNKFTFVVNPLVNKSTVKKAVEKMFNIKPLKCNIICRKGKLKRSRVKLLAGYSKDIKIAVVTLPKGTKIDFFEGF